MKPWPALILFLYQHVLEERIDRIDGRLAGAPSESVARHHDGCRAATAIGAPRRRQMHHIPLLHGAGAFCRVRCEVLLAGQRRQTGNTTRARRKA
jgi:hypothetical protein